MEGIVMKDILVSVILVAYNAERFLADAINSVLNQTHKNIQLIVVDDGSTDATADIARNFLDSRIEFYRLTENRHISFATNVGLKYVKGEYIAIIDSDDMWAENKLEKQLEYLRDHPEHRACFTWVDLIDENGSVINESNLPLYYLFACKTDTQEEWLRFFFFMGNRLNNPSSLVETKAAREVGDHHLFYIQAQDMEWWVRFTKKYSFGVIEEPLTKYRRLINSESSVSSISEEHDARFYNELMHIHYHFFDDMEDELFIRVFSPYFVKKDSRTKEELACEKVFLLLEGIKDSQIPRAVGLMKAEELLLDPTIAEVMWKRYRFSTRECGKYTGLHIYNDPCLQEKMYLYLSVCRELEEKKNACEIYSTEIEGLKSVLQEKDIQMEKKQQENLDLLQALHTITSSTSWKVTAPIRRCMDLLRRNK